MQILIKYDNETGKVDYEVVGMTYVDAWRVLYRVLSDVVERALSLQEHHHHDTD